MKLFQTGRSAVLLILALAMLGSNRAHAEESKKMEFSPRSDWPVVTKTVYVTFPAVASYFADAKKLRGLIWALNHSIGFSGGSSGNQKYGCEARSRFDQEVSEVSSGSDGPKEYVVGFYIIIEAACDSTSPREILKDAQADAVRDLVKDLKKRGLQFEDNWEGDSSGQKFGGGVTGSN